MGRAERDYGIFLGGAGYAPFRSRHEFHDSNSRMEGFSGPMAYHRYKIEGHMPLGESRKLRRSAWTQAQYKLLRIIAPKEPTTMDGSAFVAKGKLRTLLGDAFLEEIRGKTVLDFGCGEGAEAVEMASVGAERVIGLDIQTTLLARGRARAKEVGVADRCIFVTATDEPSEIVTSIDAFEHFHEPEAALVAMYGLLKPRGRLVVSFGPTWYHPLGGHLFSVFPWAHLVFSEDALIAWRSDFKTDGATKFHETAGGLNCMTISRFERMVENGPFEIESLEAVPIRKLRWLHSKWTREWTTAIVRARLRKSAATPDYFPPAQQ